MTIEEFLSSIRQECPKLDFSSNTYRSIKEVRLADDGSVRTYIDGIDEPIRFFGDNVAIFTTTVYKRLVTAIAENFSVLPWYGKIATSFAIFFNFKVFSKWIAYVIENTAVLLYDKNTVLLKEEHWSQVVKEVRRAFKGIMDESLLNGLSLILEYDDAYRYRFQYVMSFYDKKAPIRREVLGLLEILRAGELRDSVNVRKWKKVKSAVSLVLLLPSVRRAINNCLQELNLKELEFSKEDKYWISQYSGYDYGIS